MGRNDIYSMPTRNFSTSDKGCTNIILAIYRCTTVYDVVYNSYIVLVHDTIGEYSSMVQAGGSRVGMLCGVAWYVCYGMGRVDERMYNV